MSHLLRLPLELLSEIYSYLNTKDLLQCQFVCRQCSEVAQKAMYSGIELNDQEQTYLLARTVTNTSPSLGRHLKRLIIDYTPGILPSHCFESILRHTSNLQEIQFRQAFLEFWECLSKNREYLKYLDYIPFPNGHQELDSYYQIAASARNSLKSLMICDFLRDLDEYKKEYHILIASLKHYQKLEELIYISVDKFSVDEFNEIIDKISSLKKLILNINQNLVTSPLYVHRFEPNNKIQHLKATVYFGSEKFLAYIMNKFPNLQHLFLKCGLQQNYSDSFSTIFVEHFTDYLKRLKKFNMFFTHAGNIVEFVSILLAKLSSSHIKMLLKIEYSSETKLEMSYSSQEDASKSKVQLYIDTGINLLLVRPTILPLSTFIDSLNISSRDQHSTFACTESASVTGFDDLHGAVIGSRDIFGDCIKLKELKLYQYRLVESSGEARISSPIDTLFLNYCQYSPSALFELSYHLTNLKYLTLIGTNMHSFENFECSHLFIDMPYTSFDTFAFGHSLSFSWYTYIYVKLSTTHGEKYIKYVKGDSHQATQQEYEKAVLNQLILTLELKCKKIKKLQVHNLNEPEHVTYTYNLNQQKA